MRYQCRGLADLVDTDDQLKCGVIFERPVNEHLSTIIVKAQIECAVEDEQQGRFLSGASQAHYDFSGCKLQFAGTERFDRSEEHTSELQSLMRNSYAVFCL